jgi:hypothetical protein
MILSARQRYTLLLDRGRKTGAAFLMHVIADQVIFANQTLAGQVSDFSGRAE